MNVVRAAVATLALLCVMALPSGCEAHPPFGRMADVTGTLILADGGICSGTAVGPHVIASAAHCVADDPVEIRFRGQLFRITSIVRDGSDHALIRVDGDLGDFAKLGLPPKIGDTLHVIGNPGGRPQLYRRAVVAGRPAGEEYRHALYVDCRCWKGDSGAALFNDRGQLVGIVSAIDGEGLWYMTVAFPFTFTAQQWKDTQR